MDFSVHQTAYDNQREASATTETFDARAALRHRDRTLEEIECELEDAGHYPLEAFKNCKCPEYWRNELLQTHAIILYNQRNAAGDYAGEIYN